MVGDCTYRVVCLLHPTSTFGRGAENAFWYYDSRLPCCIPTSTFGRGAESTRFGTAIVVCRLSPQNSRLNNFFFFDLFRLPSLYLGLFPLYRALFLSNSDLCNALFVQTLQASFPIVPSIMRTARRSRTIHLNNLASLFVIILFIIYYYYRRSKYRCRGETWCEWHVQKPGRVHLCIRSETENCDQRKSIMNRTLLFLTVELLRMKRSQKKNRQRVFCLLLQNTSFRLKKATAPRNRP